MSNAGIGYGTITITDLSDKPFQWNYIVGTQNPDISTPEKVPHLQGQISNTYTSDGIKSVATRGFRITNTAAKRVLIRFGAGANASASITEDNLMGLTAGQTYTLSFDARWKVLSGTSETTTRYMEASFYDNSANSASFSRTAYQRFGTVTTADRGKDMTGRCEFTFTIPQTATKCYILIANNRTTTSNYASGDYIEILNVMLEDGEYFTSWSPNPLDLNGTNGEDGEDGDDGKGISEIIEYYQISNSNSTAPSTWLTSPIATTVENPYLWSYEEIVYTIGNPYISSPRVIGTRGANGSDGHGYSCAQIILYKRSATTPSNKPGDLTYTFSTGLLSGENSSSFNGWSQQIPSGSEPLWMIAATATGTGSTDIISFNEWTSTPVKILENGADGYNQVTLILYQRNSQQPSTPTDTINYNFSTGEWTPPSGWFKQIPTSDGNPCWITTAVVISRESSASTNGWSDVIKIVEDGAQGYSVVAYITHDSFTESQWATYGTIGHAETWSSTSSIRNGCRIGDLFAVVGVSTDGGKAHTAFYRSTTASGNLQGECIAHTYSNAGADAQWYYGTALTHTSGTASLATSNTAGVIIGAMYLNTSTSLVYKCTAISGSTATWTYAGNLTDGVIDNIEIGGRNLLLNSSFTNDFDKWTKQGSPVITTVDGLSCGHIIGLSSGIVYAQQNISDAIKNDEEEQIYTISADIKVVDYVSTASGTMLDLYFGGSYNNNGTSTWLGATRISGLPQGGHLMDYNNLGWQRVYYTFRFSHKPTKMTFSVYVKNCTGDLYFRNLKLEKGNMPSDWSPAPEDVSNEINTAINNLQTNLQSQLDEKIQTWVQNTDPSINWDTSTEQTNHNGDLWYYTGISNTTIRGTTINPSCTYQYNGTDNSWSRYDSTSIQSLFDFADGKSTIYYGTTSGTYANVEEGDYLVDNTNGSTYSWNGSNWVKVTDYQTSIENAIDDIEIGGRNYYIIKDSSSGYLASSISSLSAASSSRKERTSDFIAVTPGEKLTAQVWATPASGEQPWIAYMFCQSDKETAVGSRVAKFGTANETYLAYINIEVPANAAYVRVSARMWSDGKIKVEKSSMSTDWTPAPEDVSNDILEAVDNISIGGRNLLLATASEKTSQASSDNSSYTDYYYFSDFGYTLFNGNTEDELTVSFNYETVGATPSGTNPVRIYSQINTAAGDTVFVNVEANETGRYVGTYKLNSTQAGYTKSFRMRVRLQYAANGATVKIWNVKLERGNRATDWTPAPEDVDASITDIQNKITAIYGTCSTAAGTAAKEVVCSNFVLYDGVIITVNCSTANTAAAPTLNVNGTGDIAVYFAGAVTASSNAFLWGAGASIQFTYNGTYWIPIGYPCSYYGACSTGASTRAKASTINQAVICKGTAVNIQFTNTNTYTSNTVQLNISSTGAKNIYANGAQWKGSSTYNWVAGSTVAFVFDGQYWRMQNTTALQSASGKNNNYYSDINTAPTGNFTTGDTWFVLDNDGYVSGVKQWDGTQWVTTEYTSGIFSAIDAGKITAGYMNAGRINAGILRGTNNQLTYFDLDNAELVTQSIDSNFAIYLHDGMVECERDWLFDGDVEVTKYIASRLGDAGLELISPPHLVMENGQPVIDSETGEREMYKYLAGIGIDRIGDEDIEVFYSETPLVFIGNDYFPSSASVLDDTKAFSINEWHHTAASYGKFGTNTGIEIYGNPYSPYIDFHRSASLDDLTQAVDFNTRLIANVDNQLQLEHHDGSKTVFPNGNIRIYATSPALYFHYNKAANATARIEESSSGVLKAYNSISNGSDQALKKDILPIDARYLELIDKLEPKEFRFKDSPEYKHLGFIAQDVDDILDEIGIEDKPLVFPPTNEDDYYALDYQQIIPALVAYCQDLRKEINELKSRLGE